MLSARSSNTQASSRASTVRSSKNRYRTKARASEVDDMLFGESNAEKVKKERETQKKEPTLHFATGSALPGKGSKVKNRKPETVRVITKDLIRDVVVPSDGPIENSIILSNSSFGNLHTKATEMTADDATILEQKRKERDEILRAMAERKAIMQEYDLKRSEKAPLNDLQLESRTIAEELLKRSQAKRLEENDEIKHLNELILEAKCHAIRDAQIKEKEDVVLAMKQENDRLDAMMEIDRVQAILQQEEVDRRRKDLRHLGAVQVLKQIESNQMEKLLETEKKDQEARMLVENQKKLQMQDLAEIKRKQEEQVKLQQEIDAINKAHQKQKAMRKEQEQLEHQRVVQYEKEKLAREIEREKEQEEKKRQKEIEIAKLRAAQEKASDLQAEADALRAKRHEEATEREYRRKAREEMAKKAALDSEMSKAREEQIESKRYLMAVQAARERAEFDKTMLENQKEVAAMAEAEKKREQNQRNYSQEVRKQIKEREQASIADRKAFFEETIQMDKEIEEKNKMLEEVKRNKLKALQQSGVPEKYVLEVARRIGLSAL